MITPFLQSQQPRPVSVTSLVWLSITTLLALVLTLVGAWGQNTSKRVDQQSETLSKVVTQQAVDQERFSEIQKSLREQKAMIQVLLDMHTKK